MAGSSADGVVDHRNRVFGYKNMYICDGSVLAANLGVNPEPDHLRGHRAGHELHPARGRACNGTMRAEQHHCLREAGGTIPLAR